MKIDVHLHTILQRLSPEGMVNRLEVELPAGSTLGDLVNILKIGLEPGALLLVVNGRTAEIDYVLSDRDKVNLMPALSGG